MRKILSSIILIALLAITTADITAAKKDRKSRNDAQLMMLSNAEAATHGQTFVIDGHVALDIPDSCYNIYITDIDKEITDADFVACVPVKNKKFRFETDINTMKVGRIRAVMPEGHLCSAWIQIYFIPGFTVDMTVHNGYYDIQNQSAYQYMVTSWLNKEPLATLFESMGADIPESNETEFVEVTNVLNTYQYMISQLQSQITYLRHMSFDARDEQKKLLKQIDQINQKMEAIIDKYSESVQK